MHELSIMYETLEHAEAAARRENATRIHRIRLRIGALSGVVAESLEFAFETLRLGTMAEDARLDIERIPATFHCGACGGDVALDEVEFVCPACAGPLTLKNGGREMEIADLEVS